MIADGLKYEYISTAFDISLGYQDIKIIKGGETETRIVYLVKGHPDHARLKYDSIYGPTLERISHYPKGHRHPLTVHHHYPRPHYYHGHYYPNCYWVRNPYSNQ